MTPIVRAITSDTALAERLRLPCKPLSLSEASRRIIGCESTTEFFAVPKPDISMESDWPMERDFEAINTPVRVYSIEGHGTKIIIPERFAAQLDVVRHLRLGTEIDPATAASLDPTLRDRALPEDFIGPLDELPCSRPIERLYLLDGPCYLDPWLQKASGNPSFWAQATCQHPNVTFYRKDRDPLYTSAELRHEWAHLLCDEMPSERTWFDLAVAHEGRSYAPRECALIDDGERHAVLMGEEMLSPAAERFLKLTRHAPLQSVLLADELRKYFSDFGYGDDGPVAKAVLARVTYIETSILPSVVERLVADVRDSLPGRYRTEAGRILVGLGQGHLLNDLPNVTSLDLSNLPIGAPRLSWLAENRHIEDLNLARTFVGGSLGSSVDLEFLRNLPLRVLSLARTSIRNSRLRPLEGLATLEDLDLSSSSIDDAGLMALEALCRTTNLHRLDLNGTVISPKAVAWLRNRFPDTEILSSHD